MLLHAAQRASPFFMRCKPFDSPFRQTVVTVSTRFKRERLFSADVAATTINSRRECGQHGDKRVGVDTRGNGVGPRRTPIRNIVAHGEPLRPRRNRVDDVRMANRQ
jgi:hypothetical protein